MTIKPEDCKKHCWHMANFQHAVMNHRDDTCCWCGENKCVRLRRIPLFKGHGPYNTEFVMEEIE